MNNKIFDEIRILSECARHLEIIIERAAPNETHSINSLQMASLCERSTRNKKHRGKDFVGTL